MTSYRRHDQDHPQGKKKLKKEKWLSEKALKIAEKRREVKGKGEKKKIYPFEHRIPKNSKEQ